MRAMMLVAFGLLLAPVGRSSVHFLGTPVGRCSAVVVGPHRAYTAAHCFEGDQTGRLDDVMSVVGTVVGGDLELLRPVRGHFPPPYAVAATTATLPERLLVEGWGCDAGRVWFVSAYRRSIRAATAITVMPWAGMELAYLGQVCPGDSGGALWADGGGLVGIITARATASPERIGFATPIP